MESPSVGPIIKQDPDRDESADEHLPHHGSEGESSWHEDEREDELEDEFSSGSDSKSRLPDYASAQVTARSATQYRSEVEGNLPGSREGSPADDGGNAGMSFGQRRRLKRDPATSDLEEGDFKRLRSSYHDSARKLLNGEIRELVSYSDRAYGELRPSRIGVLDWTSAEKETFFTALSRYGRDNVQEISVRIGTKSAVEVQEYLQLLHSGMKERALDNARTSLLGTVDVPAALQLSEELCAALERGADELASRQERWEDQEESRKWGKFWLLSADVNHQIKQWGEFWLDSASSSQQDGIKAAQGEMGHRWQGFMRAMQLFDLENWLELSTRVFMNPSSPREAENWQNLAEEGKQPAIRTTAFLDFHRLAVDLTKKLVSATIFVTMSRLRAMTPGSFHRKDHVKQEDVEAAVKMLGLQANREQFWIGCARRCNLEVHRRLALAVHLRGAMDYDKVEKLLSSEDYSKYRVFHQHPIGEEHSASSSDTYSEVEEGGSDRMKHERRRPSISDSSSADDGSSQEYPMRDLASEYMKEFELDYREPIDPSDSEFDRPQKHHNRFSKRAEEDEIRGRGHDAHAEAADLKASLEEEHRLWEMLELEPPFPIKPELLQVPERPMEDRKTHQALTDWRTRIEYISEWDGLEALPPPGAFTRPSNLPQHGGTQYSSAKRVQEHLESEAPVTFSISPQKSDDSGEEREYSGSGVETETASST
jgi:hypothetical protein